MDSTGKPDHEHDEHNETPEDVTEVTGGEQGEEDLARQLPSDLPRSLDDRRDYVGYSAETEYYDGWQGQSQFLSARSVNPPLSFNLSLNEPDDDGGFDDEYGNDEARIAQLYAARALKKDYDAGESEEDEILADEKLTADQKTQALQDFLFMAASNGDAERLKRLVRGAASRYVKVNAVDLEGSPPLVYASCFGHKEVVMALLDVGADVDGQDRNQWTPLMWAITNRHKDIAKVLLDHGASTEAKSSSGRTALDFVPSNSDMSEFLHQSGYSIGGVGGIGITDDFYNAGFSQDKLEEELAENEMRRRMAMESAINLEVDLGNLGLDEQPESPIDPAESNAFVWDRCLNDQMFVFMESDVERILDIVITNMTPQRSASQKPVPANIVFLGARYAHYHGHPELLADWLMSAQSKIYDVVDRHQWDMTILAFWISNATLLLYYLKKDTGLTGETAQFQAQMAELIHEIFILITRDAERRMDKILDVAMLDHETIPGFEDIAFQNEWKFLRSKSKVKPEPIDKRYRPPSPKRKAQISPRNITSLLSSTLFVLDLYDVHSVIITQILSQLYYWLGAEIFNRIMSNKRYLARTKAMQIRMNISTLEDWARINNRQPDHYENGSLQPSGESTTESARKHLAPVVQLLQWLQCFSSLGEDHDAMAVTLQQLPSLSVTQLLHAVKQYRAEVGEKSLNRSTIRYIQEVKSRPKSIQSINDVLGHVQALSPATPNGKAQEVVVPVSPQGADEDEAPVGNLLNPAMLLPFHLPTSTDMLVSFGAGIGGMNREREKHYVPTVPADFLGKLDTMNGQVVSDVYENARFSDGDST